MQSQSPPCLYLIVVWILDMPDCLLEVLLQQLSRWDPLSYLSWFGLCFLFSSLKTLTSVISWHEGGVTIRVGGVLIVLSNNDISSSSTTVILSKDSWLSDLTDILTASKRLKSIEQTLWTLLFFRDVLVQYLVNSDDFPSTSIVNYKADLIWYRRNHIGE